MPKVKFDKEKTLDNEYPVAERVPKSKYPSYEDMVAEIKRKRKLCPMGSKCIVLGYTGIGTILGYSGQTGVIIVWPTPPRDTQKNEMCANRAYVIYYRSVFPPNDNEASDGVMPIVPLRALTEVHDKRRSKRFRPGQR